MTGTHKGVANDRPTADDRTGATPRLALRPREAARALAISERKLWELTADKSSGIPHCRFGKCVVYPVRELANWLAVQVAKGVHR